MSEVIRFPVTGMTCSTCVNRITRALRRLEGVDQIRVDLGTELVTLRRAVSTDDRAITDALRKAGYVADLEAAVPAVPAAPAAGLLARVLRR